MHHDMGSCPSKIGLDRPTSLLPQPNSVEHENANKKQPCNEWHAPGQDNKAEGKQQQIGRQDKDQVACGEERSNQSDQKEKGYWYQQPADQDSQRADRRNSE